MSIQYRVAFGKKDEVVDGPDDADVVVSVAASEATNDPAVLFMTGRLKAVGSTGRLLDAIADGSAAAALNRLASCP